MTWGRESLLSLVLVLLAVCKSNIECVDFNSWDNPRCGVESSDIVRPDAVTDGGVSRVVDRTVLLRRPCANDARSSRVVERRCSDLASTFVAPSLEVLFPVSGLSVSVLITLCASGLLGGLSVGLEILGFSDGVDE